MSENLFYFIQCFRRFGWKALYKQFRPNVRRSFSRQLIKSHAPHGPGLEIGVGYQTIAPIQRTVLSDGFEIHGKDKTLAKEFFPSEKIPYPDHSFQFILSEHMLEHSPNPLKSLREWSRVLKPGGCLFLFLPHRLRSFDRERPRTSLSHLIDDETKDVGSNDQTHLHEWMNLVINQGLAPHYAETPESEQLSKGLVHHHVWEPEDALEFLKYVGFKISEYHDQAPDRFDSFVIVAQK